MYLVTKGQLISKCLFEKIVWTKIPTKNLIDSAHYTCWAESIKFFVGILVQTIFSKRHSEIIWPLAMDLGLKSSVGWVPIILYEPSQEEVIKKYHTSTLDVFYRVSEYELYYRFETFSHFPFNKWILLEFESIFSAFFS